jgi:hypothetical protein
VKDKKIKKNHEKFDIKIAKNNVGRHDQIKNKKNDKVRTNGKSKKHKKEKKTKRYNQSNK